MGIHGAALVAEIDKKIAGHFKAIEVLKDLKAHVAVGGQCCHPETRQSDDDAVTWCTVCHETIHESEDQHE